MKMASKLATTSTTSVQIPGLPSLDLRITVVEEEVAAMIIMAPVKTTVTENSRVKRAESEVAGVVHKQLRRRNPSNVTNLMTIPIRLHRCNEPEKLST